jgi:HEAT repeat protein
VHTTRSLSKYAGTLLIAAVLLSGCALRAAEDESKLIEAVKSGPIAEKAMACKKLVLCGTKACVPALAALLPDKDLTSWARIPLEAIPDPACDEALRDAAGKVQGRILVGVINSLSVRRDAKAVDLLIGKMKDADVDVACAAAEALGRIGGDAAAKALVPALATGPAQVRDAAAMGCGYCAEKMFKEGKADDAVKIYDAIGATADLAKQRMLEAKRGSILARKNAGIPLLIEALKSPDKQIYGIGLRTARELPGPEATQAIVTELEKAAPQQQILLILVLTDRGDPKALPPVLALAKSGQGKVRQTALSALEKIGNASCVPVLLEAALDADAEISQTGRAILAKMAGAEVEAEIASRLGQATGKAREVLVEVAGQRRIEAALPAMLQSAADADAGVRAVAITALGGLAGEKQLADLVKILQANKDAKEQAAFEKAVMSISARGGAACSKHLLPLLQGGDAAMRTIGLHTLACSGGADALTAVKAALADKDEAIQDEAVRTLSNWPNKFPEDDAVAEPLQNLVKTGAKPLHKILGLRGYLQYLQVAKKVGDADKLTKLNEVLPLVTRPEEKRLAISVLGTIGVASVMDTLIKYAAEPDVAQEACMSIVNLCEQKGGTFSKESRQQGLQLAAEKLKGEPKKKASGLLKNLK